MINSPFSAYNLEVDQRVSLSTLSIIHSYFNTAEFDIETFLVTSSRIDSQFCKVDLTKRTFAGKVNGSPLR